MAVGNSKRGIAEAFVITERRRVLAVFTYLHGVR
jgi:hypothetical protein